MIEKIGVLELFIVLMLFLLLVGGGILLYKLIKSAVKKGQIEAYKEMNGREEQGK